MHPEPDDVVVAKIQATVDFSVSVVARTISETYPKRAHALTRGHELAAHRRSRLWLTEDQTHFLLVAVYGAPRSR